MKLAHHRRVRAATRAVALTIVTVALLLSSGRTEVAAAAKHKGLKGVIHAGKARKLPREARQRLAQDGSVVVTGQEPHFFALYDRNAYRGIPSFVSLDAVLHVFHLRIDDLVASAEREVALPALKTFAGDQARRALKLLREQPRAATRLRPLAAYHGVAFALLEPNALGLLGDAPIDPALRKQIEDHVARIEKATGSGATALCPRTLDFSLFKPRGHYDRYHLDRYFRAVTFYAQCALDLERDDGLARALDLARLLDGPARERLKIVTDLIRFVAGPPDDVDLWTLEPLIKGLSPLPAVPSTKRLAAARASVAKLQPGRVVAQAVPAEAPRRVFRLLGAARVPDAELFSRTADWRAGRAYPSALDLLAALGSADARGLLLEDAKKVPALGAAIEAGLNLEAEGLYGRWLAVLREALKPPGEGHPDFERTEAWQRHLTVAAAGSWAELRHDTLLYVKQPLHWAQGGGGDQLPAAKAGGYVEPRPEVFRQLRDLLDQAARHLPAAATSGTREVAELRDLLDFLIEVAGLELAGKPIPRAVDRRLRGIGTELERLTLGHGDELPPQAVIADVFTHVSPEGATRALEVGIGDVDELWVVVPRGKRRVLMRGGVFSYYEFVGAPGERLTDGEWLGRLRDAAPERPAWARPVQGPKRSLRRHGGRRRD